MSYQAIRNGGTCGQKASEEVEIKTKHAVDYDLITSTTWSPGITSPGGS